MLARYFLDHPRAVGESYLQHQRVAWRVAGQMLAGGAACAVHGFLPFLFTTTGSRTIERLHKTLRHRHEPERAA
jgi:hypothetical protein